MYLYGIQRNLLVPKVDEQAKSKGGLQHVEVEWQVGPARHRGAGAAKSIKAARQEAARHLLRGLPISEAAGNAMRKQMLNGLRMRLGAEVVEDAPAAKVNGAKTARSHRIVWRVPRDGGRQRVELSAEGAGESATEAHAMALEDMYGLASRMPPEAGPPAPAAKASPPPPPQRGAGAGAAASGEAGKALTALTSEAAGEVAIRHNAVVQRHGIKFNENWVDHKAGFYCSLEWRWSDENGRQQTRTTTGLGNSKKTAKAEAMQRMLVAQGYAEDLPSSALNQAARIRGMAKAGDDEDVVPAACTFCGAWPPTAWGLVLPDVWQCVLAAGDSGGASRLGEAMRGHLEAVAESERAGLPADLWEQLLDACALIACSGTSRAGLAAVDRLPLASAGFPSPSHRDYFHHFRRLLAWERLGMNQAAVGELRETGGSRGATLDRELCLLPYLTLAAKGDAVSRFFMADVRTGDVVYLQPCEPNGSPQGGGHLAVVTSASTPASPVTQIRCKVTLRCSTLSATDADAQVFAIHGLDSEVTALRCIRALRELTLPGSGAAQGAPTFTPELRRLLIASFHGREGAAEARAIAEEHPPGCGPADSVDQEADRARRVALASDAALSRGAALTPAQLQAVQQALSQRLTLIHGPPGTGKTTAAIAVVLAWRSLGDKILCAADSNVAADQLHASLAQWGVKALRFSLSEPGGANEPIGGDRRAAQRFGSSAQGPARRRGGGGMDQGSTYERLLAMRDAVNDFQVVVATCASAGHELLASVRFPRVLVDECTQSVEPATLIPLGHGCSHVVLIGDHRQLPPTVIMEEAQNGGLERSLFARLAGDEINHMGLGDSEAPRLPAILSPVLLDEQRRMHPSIAAFPNAHFYNALVRNAAPDRPPVPGLPWPRGGDVRVLLVDVGGAGGEETRGSSFRNAAEVEAVLDLAEHALQGDRGQQAGLAAEELAVITPYALQKHAFQAEFARRAAITGSRAARLAQARVSTIDGFQGAECDLVIFSAVRSNSAGRLGFLRDARRANVVLTRARRGLVVFADAGTMRQARGTVWERWLAWADAAGAVMPLAAFRAALSSSGAPASPAPPPPPLPGRQRQGGD